MRILYLSPHPTHDIVSNVGYSTHQREMIAAMRALGHDVIPVIVGGQTSDDLPKQTKAGQSSSFIRFLKSIVPGMVWRTIKDVMWLRHDLRVVKPMLEEAIRTHQPDLIYERSEYALKQGSVLAQQYGVTHIYEVNAPCVEEWIEFEGRSLLTPHMEKIERIKYTLSSGLCPVSSSLGEFLHGRYAIPVSKILTIPNAINPEVININQTRVSELKHYFRFADGDVVIGFVGSVLAYHGVDLLVENFEKLCSKVENVHLLIVGDGALLQPLKKRVSSAGIDDKVVFTGKVPYADVFNHIAVMDICVNPKHSWYGSPIKLFEYGAMGKAIIAPNESNIRDVLTDDQSALLIDTSEQALMDALDLLCTDQDKRLVLGSKAQKMILENHTWEQNALRVIAFAEQLNQG